MADEAEYFFTCNKLDCIQLYNEYTELLNNIRVDLDALNSKTLKLEGIAKKMKSAHPTDLMKTPTWPDLRGSIKQTLVTANKVNHSVAFVRDALNVADVTVKEIENVMTKPRELLMCKNVR